MQQSRAWFIVGGKAAPLAANAGQLWVAQQRPCARLCGHQAQGALPGAGGAPAAVPSTRRARPALEGLNFGPGPLTPEGV